MVEDCFVLLGEIVFFVGKLFVIYYRVFYVFVDGGVLLKVVLFE